MTSRPFTRQQIAEHLLEWMENSSESQNSTAQILDVSRVTVSKWVNQHSDPHPTAIHKMQRLGILPDGDEDDPQVGVLPTKTIRLLDEFLTEALDWLRR